ncbi:MAG: phage portal protein [Sneathiella sp.]|uniref:phage portal protein n=1 Tax=Sneathiella sp. TaxID=1964365 RepID=UPI00300296C1
MANRIKEALRVLMKGTSQKGHGSLTNGLGIGSGGWPDRSSKKESARGESLPAVYRAGTIAADAMASSNFELHKKMEEGGSVVIRGTDTASALAAMTYSDIETAVWNMVILGNGYLRVVRNDRGGIHRFEALPSEITHIEVDKTTNKIFYVVPANTLTGKEKQIYPESEIVHLKYRTTHDSLYGTSPLNTLSPSLTGWIATRRAVSSLMDNVVHVSGWLSTESVLDEGVIARLSGQWRNLFASNGSKFGGAPVLEQGVSWNQTDPLSAVDSQLIELCQFNITEVANCFGLHPYHLGLIEKTPYASAVEASRGLVSMFLAPIARRIESAFNTSILTRAEISAGYGFRIPLDNLVRSSGKDLSDSVSQLLNAGIITVDESRAMVGLGQTEGGGERHIPTNTAPASRWVDGNVGLPDPDTQTDDKKEAAIISLKVDNTQGDVVDSSVPSRLKTRLVESKEIPSRLKGKL